MMDSYLDSFFYEPLCSDFVTADLPYYQLYDIESDFESDHPSSEAEATGYLEEVIETRFYTAPKRIGTLTAEERQLKVVRYREKRTRRVWTKKINYDCRKKVADHRLRVKGRFVTKEQADAMLEPRLR